MHSHCISYPVYEVGVSCFLLCGYGWLSNSSIPFIIFCVISDSGSECKLFERTDDVKSGSVKGRVYSPPAHYSMMIRAPSLSSSRMACVPGTARGPRLRTRMAIRMNRMTCPAALNFVSVLKQPWQRCTHREASHEVTHTRAHRRTGSSWSATLWP